MPKYFSILVILSVFLLPSLHSSPDQDLDKSVFSARRQALMKKMETGIAFFRSPGTARITSFGSSYRQNSNYYYLFGIEEPDAVFVLRPVGEETFVAFVQERNVMAEIWGGKMLGTDGAVNIHGADRAYPLTEADKMIPQYLRGQTQVYCDFSDLEFMEKIISMQSRMPAGGRAKLVDITPLIHEHRLIKGPEEQALLTRSVDITAEAMREAMKATAPGTFEFEIEAIIHYIYARRGCRRPGFKSIIASGANAAVMHYQSNRRKMVHGDLLLMDIGAEYGYYSGDITRTIPVSGRFSARQKEIYTIVLKAQKAGIRIVKPGTGIKEVMKASTDILVDELFRLGLITDKASRWQAMTWMKYFQTSHWLGLDTHDTGDYRWQEARGRILEPGMVLTIEPGIYIGENDLDNVHLLYKNRVKKEDIDTFIEKVRPVFETYKNVSVRIEDDILVTDDGCSVLSRHAPKEISEIEQLMKRKSSFR